VTQPTDMLLPVGCCGYPLRRIPNKTAYILGAGFSKPAGIPTLSTFVTEAINLLLEDQEKKFSAFAKEVKAIQTKYDTAACYVDINLNNLEDLFCLVDLPLESCDRCGLHPCLPDTDNQSSPPTPPSQADLGNSPVSGFGNAGCYGIANHGSSNDRDILKALIAYVMLLAYNRGEKERDPTHAAEHPSKWVKNSCFFGRETPASILSIKGVYLYDAFVSCLLNRRQHFWPNEKPPANPRDCLLWNDAVITLNYDLVIEQAARRLHTIPYYGIGDPISATNTFSLIKLHGSVNWRDLNGRLEVVKDEDLKNTLSDRNQNRSLYLVPPTWRKGEDTRPHIANLACQAVAHLRAASRIVIIGYSLSESDRHFHYMLAQSLNTLDFPRIEVWDVCPEENMKPLLRKAFGKNNYEGGLVKYNNTGALGYVMNQKGVESR